jgi:catechol 2,3-dioxygenase-like lactoylglutathione lyase family enzyme
MTAQALLLDHSDLYHVGLFVDDVEAAMAHLGKRRGLSWTAVHEHVLVAWLPGAGPEEVVAVGAYSLGGPVHVEVTKILAGPLPKSGDLVTPHHVGYWCDDVMATADRLVASGWTLDFKAGFPGQEPTIAAVRSPSGYGVELVPSASRSRVEQKLATPAS